MAGYKVHRYHDISCGHRVHGHEGKCCHLHGHNYRVHFTCVAEDGALDGVGRVIDFSQVKAKLCMWLEDNWDHKFLAWKEDPLMKAIATDVAFLGFEGGVGKRAENMLDASMVWTDFNPTAENIAQHLVEVVGPAQLAGTGIKLSEVMVEETMKCFASYGA